MVAGLPITPLFFHWQIITKHGSHDPNKIGLRMGGRGGVTAHALSGSCMKIDAKIT
jgi:hypothetical protein